MIDDRADWHTHSDVTDGADPLSAMVDAGRAAGLHTLGLSDHVRADTTWLPDYVATVRGLGHGEMSLRCGVEAKMLDSSGALDAPPGLEALDYLLIADHQYPSAQGPVHPRVVSEQVASGALGPETVISTVIAATAAAVAASPVPAIVAHLFSLLPKCGVDESLVHEDMLEPLITAARRAEARVEVNEKWRCPSKRVVDHLSRYGVEITAGSDAHRAVDVGRWSYLREVTAQA
ncbi:MAG: PHP domain-containing protein [Ornithinimicrobium sp.]